MEIAKLSKEQRKERRMIRNYLANVIEQRAEYAAIKLIREEKDVDEDTAENIVIDLFEALPMLKLKRKFILGIAKWYVKGYFDYENKESCSRINALLKVAFNSIVTHNVYGNFYGDFYSERTNCCVTPEDLRISLGMEFGEQKDVEFEASNYTLKEVKFFDEKIYKLRELFLEGCIAKDRVVFNLLFNLYRETFNLYTENGRSRMFLAFRDDYEDVKRIAGGNPPHDSYGYSIICITLDVDGNVLSSTSRWSPLYELEEFLSDSEAQELMKKAKRE